jgi:peptidoglycan/LPS O-acetylase OafA/YrhL
VNAGATGRRPARLDFLDGLRGAASLYVVLFHAAVGFSSGEPAGWVRGLRRLLSFGHEAVAIFIVLSGYCLMLPVARAGLGRLPRGLGDYFVRRARRILPPYYATLGASLGLIALVPALRSPAPTGTIWDNTHPAFAAGPLLSHLALVHNVWPAWAMRINGPLWSVATEWQIYFFFPFVLLPAWRRAGMAGSLALAFAVGYGLTLLWPVPAVSAVSWYLALFALGMVAAGIGHAARPQERELRAAVPWGVLALVLALACAVGGLVFAQAWFLHKPRTDLLVGVATAALLVHCTRQVADGLQPGPVVRLLHAPALVGLGHFSYSLYLSHLPVVALCFLAVRPLGLAPLPHMLAMLALSVPASLLVAYGFHRAVERRFMRL